MEMMYQICRCIKYADDEIEKNISKTTSPTTCVFSLSVDDDERALVRGFRVRTCEARVPGAIDGGDFERDFVARDVARGARDFDVAVKRVAVMARQTDERVAIAHSHTHIIHRLAK